MQQTREQLLSHYSKLSEKPKNGIVILDQDELLCSYQTKTTTKLVFMTQELDRETFKRYCIIKNELNADKIVVYCETATYDSPGTLEIILNSDEQPMY